MLYKRSDVVPQLSSGLPDIDLTNNYSDNYNWFGQVEDGGFVKQRLTFDLMTSPIFLKIDLKVGSGGAFLTDAGRLDAAMGKARSPYHDNICLFLSSFSCLLVSKNFRGLIK